MKFIPMLKNAVFLIVFLGSAANQSFAQGESKFRTLGGKLGLNDIRGELAASPEILYVGYEFSAEYSSSFKNKRWHYYGELHLFHETINPNRELVQFKSISTVSSGLHAIAGLKLYLVPKHRWLRIKYDRRSRLWLPYFYGGVGPILFRTSLNEGEVRPQWDIVFDSHFAIAVDGGFALDFVINRHWKITGYLGGKYTTTDYLDAIAGLGAGTDLFARGGLGLFYIF